MEKLRKSSVVDIPRSADADDLLRIDAIFNLSKGGKVQKNNAGLYVVK
jgi:hypothetical protein